MGKTKRRKLKHGTRQHAKPKQAVTLPGTSWDFGPDTPAARDGAVVEGRPDEETGKNPNGVKGLRRKSILEVYLGMERITARQCEAGLRLYALWANDRGPSGCGTKVDTPKSGSDPLAGLVDSRRAFALAWLKIPVPCRAVIERVVLEDTRVGLTESIRSAAPMTLNWRETKRAMTRLRQGLDVLADVLCVGDVRG